MQYRTIPKANVSVSALGFGTMRFKGVDNAAEIIERGLELGINYFDCGAAYSFKSWDDNAESWVGRAIAGRDRSRLVLSSKAQCNPNAPPMVERSVHVITGDQMRECIDNALKRLGTDYLDFFQVWDMSSPEMFDVVTKPNGPLAAMRKAKDEGIVKHLGFTSHDQADNVIRYMKEAPDVDSITLYYNFSERHFEKAIEYARKTGVGVVTMGSLRGGLLVGDSPVFKKALPELDAPVQELALRFLLSTPGITTCLSGMNEIAHLEQNAAVASKSEYMTPEQRQRFVDAYLELTDGKPVCSGCRYCAGVCPQDLRIHELMQRHQMYFVFGIKEQALALIKEGAQSANMDPRRCTACETCVDKCPSKVPIPDRMEELAELLG